MESKQVINADVAQSIIDLLSVTKEFELKSRLYRILLRGRGFEFDHYRDYLIDDDAQQIDWRASKRANKLLIKQYKEERNLKVVFLIDVGENMISGSSKKLKCEYAAEVVSAFSHLIINSGDMVGYVFFSKGIKKFIPPSNDRLQFNRFLSEILKVSTYGGASELNAGLDFAIRSLSREITSIVIVSDFISFNEKCPGKLAQLRNTFECVALVIKDPIDKALPNYSAELILEDPTTGRQLTVDPKLIRKVYEKNAAAQEKFVIDSCNENGSDVLELMTDKPFASTLAQFLKGRARRVGVKR
jgi:uncharacterized protein (DUF58 family)